VLNKGKTSIVLVPEISLTPQLIHRFRAYFGDIIGVIHSRLSEGQRLDVNQRIKAGEIKIVIGARSALFAPIENIGIIIVDEEHDHSYKQTEKNPRYNCRDSALVRAKLNNAVIVLGSATPSLESFYNAKGGKYILLELPHRAMRTKQPVVEIVNMIEELKKTSKYHKRETPETRFLSSKLISYIDYALNNNQSIMLLQNRRGYSAYLECQSCGFVKMCRNCDITMIYHKTKDHLRCHYCGYTEILPMFCEKCGSEKILLKGTGTEKVEEEITRLFPHSKMKRMDSDTVKGRDAHRKILKSFHDREFEILIGTQMISKGLDFPNVYLVGVISADVGLLNPDFRSYEKTFQLLMQVSGRSGRISDYGKVIIQTMHPGNFIFEYVVNHDYGGFYDKELANRKRLNYPPFSRMSLVEVSGPDISRVNNIASKIYLHLRQNMSKAGQIEISLMKPTPALIYKIKNNYRYHVIIKTLKKSADALHVTEELLRQLDKYVDGLKIKSGEHVTIDVDPVSFY
jgi:primosomal protein N' (replication factor Y)